MEINPFSETNAWDNLNAMGGKDYVQNSGGQLNSDVALPHYISLHPSPYILAPTLKVANQST